MSAKSRTAEAYEKLKADLVNGTFGPGSKLKIDVLSAGLSVSPSVVREALSRLTSDGLVAAEPQRGFIVAPISVEDLIDLTSVRIDIETRCIRRAIMIGDPAWEGRILSALHQLRRCPDVVQGKSERPSTNFEWSRLHGEFHDSLVAACDSRWWLTLRGQLYLQAERYRRLLVPYARVKRDTAAEHDEIADAVLKRDPDLACDLVAKHFQLSADTLIASGAPFKDVPAVETPVDLKVI